MSIPTFSRRRWILTWIFGFLLPVGTLFFESLSGFCAEYLFDPLPSFLHQVVVALVPLGFLYVLNAASSADPRRSRLPFVLGTISAIASVYTLPFIPLLPAALVALVYFGLGFLPLAPLLALWVALSWTFWLARKDHNDDLPKRFAWGFLVGLLLFAVADSRRMVTHWGFEAIAADETASRPGVLRLLRIFGDEGEMLRLCTRFDPQGMLYSAEMEPETARRVYFRVTGKAIAETLRRVDAWELNNTSVAAGQTTWPMAEGLLLKSSHLHADLDPAAPLAYLQWEMVLDNQHPWPHEALAEIALPHGGFVSRATLWIEGEPREAAFGGRQQVTTAYEEVTRRKRDPLLVTTAGPDRVRIRAFPVPAQGEMRLLLGITAPLDVVRAIEGRLDLPYFSERNFRLAEGTRHRIELVNRGRPQRLYTPKGLANPFMMNDAELASFETFVAIHRDETQTAFWRGEDPQSPQRVARLVSGSRPRPRHLVVVIDGSATSQAFRSELLPVLDRLATVWPQLEVVWAGDEVQTHVSGHGGLSAAGWLAERRFLGGRDNAPALLEAIELARARTGGAVLWLGGPQAVALTPSKELEDRLSDGDSLPPIFALPLAPGAQRLWDAFEVVPLTVLPRYGSLDQDILRLPGVETGRRFFELRFALPGEPQPSLAAAASSHLDRLWAFEQVGRLLRRGDEASRDEALRLAVEHQVVTPVSGAVVLETAEQYADHDLVPVSSATVPTIPEPEVWALLLVALASMLVLWRRRIDA